MILNDELNVSLLNDNECVQTFISVFHLSTFKYNKSVDTNIYLQAHGVPFVKAPNGEPIVFLYFTQNICIYTCQMSFI